jgi:predicted ester cyclase
MDARIKGGTVSTSVGAHVVSTHNTPDLKRAAQSTVHIEAQIQQRYPATMIIKSVSTISVPALILAISTSGLAASSLTINDIVIADGITAAQRDATLKAVRSFYDFWNTGETTLLTKAVAENFTDHTLPPGRPQGPEGPAFASRQFRAAVPDLKVAVEKMIVADNYVTVHMRFTGHFTGDFGQTQGTGQRIDFIATDLVKVQSGRITDNWHIEDNLTLLQQMGVAKVGS